MSETVAIFTLDGDAQFSACAARPAATSELQSDDGAKDIEATIRWPRRQGAAKLGACGYCLGDKLSYMVVARLDADASVGCYGVTLYDHAGLDRGFATQAVTRRNEADAALADSRTAAFFAKHLA